MKSLVVFISVILSTSCGSGDNEAAVAPRPQIIVIFAPGGLGDRCYNDCILRGITSFKKVHDDDVDMYVYAPASLDDAERVFSDWLSLPESDIPALTVLGSGDYMEMSSRLLPQKPLTSNKRVLLFESANPHGLPISTFQISTYGASYLAGADYVICAPTSISDIKVIIDSFNAVADAPRLLFSDMGYGVDVLTMLGKDAEGIEGVCFGADPESGYDVAFHTYFDTDATVGSAQAYDALMLIAYAAWYRKINPGASLKQALRVIVDGRDFNMGSWMGEDMKVVIDAMEKGGRPYVRGASGSLDFDSKVYTNVLATVYSNYKVYNGHYIVLDYNTADGGNRTEATLAGWNWKAQQGQQFDNGHNIEYGLRTGNRALLVAASTGWENYRHQADVLAMYNLLKEYGYTDDDIILIMEDDIAHNPSNPEPGVVRVRPSGVNLYHDVHVDYRLSELTSDDFAPIIQGRGSDRLHDVIDSSDGDNILVFWSGHGEPGAMVWNEEKEGMTGAKLHAALSGMTSLRRMAMFVETCFSGSVFEGREWPEGMLFVTAANAAETSKADIFNSAANIWMSNRFTSTLREQITADPDIMLRDLYYRLFINTVGSHVMVYNAPLFGNLYTTSMTEFLRI